MPVLVLLAAAALAACGAPPPPQPAAPTAAAAPTGAFVRYPADTRLPIRFVEDMKSGDRRAGTPGSRASDLEAGACADLGAYVRVWDEPQQLRNAQGQEIVTDGRAAVVRTTRCSPPGSG